MQSYATAVLKEYPSSLNHALADYLAVWLTRDLVGLVRIPFRLILTKIYAAFKLLLKGDGSRSADRNLLSEYSC